MVQRIIFQSHHDYMRKKIIFWTIPVLLVIVLLVMIGDTIDNAIDNNAQTNPEPETPDWVKAIQNADRTHQPAETTLTKDSPPSELDELCKKECRDNSATFLRHSFAENGMTHQLHLTCECTDYVGYITLSE